MLVTNQRKTRFEEKLRYFYWPTPYRLSFRSFVQQNTEPFFVFFSPPFSSTFFLLYLYPERILLDKLSTFHLHHFWSRRSLPVHSFVPFLFRFLQRFPFFNELTANWKSPRFFINFYFPLRKMEAFGFMSWNTISQGIPTYKRRTFQSSFCIYSITTKVSEVLHHQTVKNAFLSFEKSVK